MPESKRTAYLREYHERTHRVSVTLSNSEFLEFERRAKAEGVKVTTLVKNMALAYHQENVIFPEPIAHELQELRFLIRNIAGNVNQMAHYSNRIRHMVDENRFLEHIKELEDAVILHTKHRLTRKTPG